MKKKLKDFDTRLRILKKKTLKESNKKNKPFNSNNVGMFLRTGVDLCSGIIIGLIIGLVLDKYFQTKPLFLIIFVFFGFAAGIMNVYRTTKKIGFEVGFKKKKW